MMVYTLVFVALLGNMQIMIAPGDEPNTAKLFPTLESCMSRLKELVDIADSHGVRRAGVCVRIKLPTQS